MGKGSRGEPRLERRELVEIGKPTRQGIELLVNLMKVNDIPYDCELFVITELLEILCMSNTCKIQYRIGRDFKIYDTTKSKEKPKIILPRALEDKRVWTTLEILNTLNHIRENRLLG